MDIDFDIFLARIDELKESFFRLPEESQTNVLDKIKLILWKLETKMEEEHLSISQLEQTIFSYQVKVIPEYSERNNREEKFTSSARYGETIPLQTKWEIPIDEHFFHEEMLYQDFVYDIAGLKQLHSDLDKVFVDYYSRKDKIFIEPVVRNFLYAYGVYKNSTANTLDPESFIFEPLSDKTRRLKENAKFAYLYNCFYEYFKYLDGKYKDLERKEQKKKKQKKSLIVNNIIKQLTQDLPYCPQEILEQIKNDDSFNFSDKALILAAKACKVNPYDKEGYNIKRQIWNHLQTSKKILGKSQYLGSNLLQYELQNLQ